jgi:hypothetical protein
MTHRHFICTGREAKSYRTECKNLYQILKWNLDFKENVSQGLPQTISTAIYGGWICHSKNDLSYLGLALRLAKASVEREWTAPYFEPGLYLASVISRGWSAGGSEEGAHVHTLTRGRGRGSILVNRLPDLLMKMAPGMQEVYPPSKPKVHSVDKGIQ